ncbi:MAG: hypothetical protein LBC77_04470 [Spirochaetaceae bacterium]|jgi:hypothetical protein|nr:hypothetical protein [Spirochaetaceae bacterium]
MKFNEVFEAFLAGKRIKAPYYLHPFKSISKEKFVEAVEMSEKKTARGLIDSNNDSSSTGGGTMKQVVMTSEEMQDFADILYEFCNCFSLFHPDGWEANTRYLNLVSWAESFRQAHMRSRKVTVLFENKE